MGSSRRSWVRRLAALVLTGAASVPLLPSESPACSSVGPDVLEVGDPAGAPAGAPEGEAPGTIAEPEVTVTRGVAPTDVGCGRQMQSSCDDLASVTFSFRPARDADSPRSQVGYLIELAAGELPETLFLSAAPLRGGDDDEVSITHRWSDGRDEAQEPIAFTVTIRAVDADGHQGPPSEPIEVVDLGR